MNQTKTVRVGDIEFVFSVQAQAAVSPSVAVEVTPADGLDNSYRLHLTVALPDEQPFTIRDVSVEWTVPVTDMHGLYFGGNPNVELTYLPYWQRQKLVCANTGVPYMALISRTGQNRAAFGLADQITETSLNAELREQTRSYHFRLQKPANKDTIGQTIPARGCWEETLYVSFSSQPWPDVLKHYVETSDTIAPLPKMRVPEHAYDPVFDSWTAIHHDVSHEWIMRNARVAADLGFRTWITDDGWQIEKGQFADYSLTGDWLPNEKKFPNFREHVAMVQALGFRYVLWISPFMIGKDSRAAKRYAHLLTTGQEHLNFNNLSPWHAESRDFIARLLERLVNDYGLDGLKIDFIDSISINSPRKEGASDDTLGSSYYHTLYAALEPLMAQHPDLLIEFRNSYTNLASRSFSNVYRSSDVPLNYTLNRWQAIMLRLLTPDRAVHLDPAIWHPDEPDALVAVHLINLLVSVPMVSIELDEYPQSHLDLIRYWIGFYNSHRETLIHGKFKPLLRLGRVPSVTFEGAQETIIGVYDDDPVTLVAATNLILLNASTRSFIELEPDSARGYSEILNRDKFGRLVSTTVVDRLPLRLPVEIGGSLELHAALQLDGQGGTPTDRETVS